jgi:hypothetical protein
LWFAPAADFCWTLGEDDLTKVKITAPPLVGVLSR